MEYCSLMSGSWGNCHFICEKDTKILIDAGQNCKRILNNLADASLGTGDSIDAIILTHAHTDHVTAVSVLCRKFNIPVYATKGCWYQMDTFCGPIPSELRHVIERDEVFTIKDMTIQAFPTSHDALDSVGYVVESNGKRIGVATDLGIVTHEVISALKDLDILVIEANHDKEMLRVGPYAQVLKRRIAGVSGHLSNDDAAITSLSIVTDRTSYVVLAHLSLDNNTPDKAKKAVEEAMKDKYKDIHVFVSPRQTPGPRLIV